eukprot:symbB.v1.2.031340.t1/scaffold3628.1/size53020/4
MGKKPILVTLEEFQDLKKHLESQIAAVSKELRSKVPVCETHIAELQVAKSELSQGLDVAKEATRRVAEDAQAQITSRCSTLEQTLGAQLGQMHLELRKANEDLQGQLQTSETEMRELLAEELRALCDRVEYGALEGTLIVGSLKGWLSRW